MAKIKRLTVKNLDLKTLRRFGIDDDPGWYIEDPNDDIRWTGPFATKEDAMVNCRELERFWRSKNLLVKEN